MLGKTIVRLLAAMTLLTPVVVLVGTIGTVAGTPGISWT
jgi:hypothetical protein